MDTIIKLAYTLSEIHNDIIIRLDFQYNTIRNEYCATLILGDDLTTEYYIYSNGKINIHKTIV